MPGLLRQVEPTVLAATSDADEVVRTRAFALLATGKHPLLAQGAQAQLGDVDPAMRLLGVEYLRQTGSVQLAPGLIPLLNDPDISVKLAVSALLGEWTGKKYVSPDVDQSVRYWKQWWAQHQEEYRNAPLGAPGMSKPRRLRASEFASTDVDGKLVRLSDGRGKLVLLNFADPVSGAGLAALAALHKLQQQNPGRLSLLTVFVKTEAIQRSHHHNHAPNGECLAPVKDPAAEQADHARMLVSVRTLARTHELNHSLVIDSAGILIRRFSAQSLPTYVLVNVDGFVYRRFVGHRTLTAFQAMVDAAGTNAFLAGTAN